MNQKIQLYINDQSVDLSNDPIPYTMVLNDLAQLQSQSGNTSNQFTLPLTQRNRIILGFPDDITIATFAPYRQYSAKLIQDAIEIIPNGFAEIKKVNNNSVDIVLLAGATEFYDQLAYQLYEMGDSSSQASDFGRNKVFDEYSKNCYWNVRCAALSQENMEGFIFPVVDFGQINDPVAYDNNLNVLGMRPAFFLHTAIDLMVKSTGYRIDKAKSIIYNDPVFSNLYKKILIPCTNSTLEHGSDYQNSPDGLGPTYQAYANTIIQHKRTGAESDQFGSVSINGFTATERTKFTAKFAFDLYMRGIYGGASPSNININFTVTSTDGSSFNATHSSFMLDDRATVISSFGRISEYTFTGNILQYDFELVAGQRLYVSYDFNHVGTSLDSTYGFLSTNASLSIEFNRKDVLYGQQIQYERILPDVSQMDFLQDTLQGFGLLLIANPNNKKITFTSFKEIVKNIPKAVDWSEKCVDIGRQISFQISNLNLSQVNFLRYTQDDSIPVSVMPRYFADSQISVDDTTLNPNQRQQDLFTRPWAPSRNRPYYNGTIAEILMIDRSEPGVDFTIGVSPRLLIDQKIDLRQVGGGQAIRFHNGNDNSEDIYVNGVISVPYFYKPDALDLNGACNHLCWKDMPGAGSTVLPGLKTTYYREFEHILKRTKAITKFFYLTPLDIMDFDFTIPVYLRQDNAYFYVNKIDSFVAGHPTKVDLVRL